MFGYALGLAHIYCISCTMHMNGDSSVAPVWGLESVSTSVAAGTKVGQQANACYPDVASGNTCGV